MQNILHDKAIQLAKTYKESESQLLAVLMQMLEEKIFLALGYPGIFDYCVKALELSEAQASYFNRVARKATEVPELKEAVVNGELSLSQARRIVPVITSENSQEWIEKAATLKQKALEAEVAEVNPKALIKERIRPVAKELREMRVALTPEQEAMLEKVQDLVSQKTGTPASLQDALDHMAKCYLEKHDPVRKAERASSRKARAARPQKSGRQPIPARIEHEVHRRDRFQCTAKDSRGNRCTSTRWLQLHHLVPVARGGRNLVENLTTLCQFHHSRTHEEHSINALG